MRIAMWSGPRNISTAMMYSFASRQDFAVWDEPFYAPYLVATGIDHPMRDEIIAAHESDPEVVAQRCLGSIPAQKPHFYMKHMPFHMVDGFPLDWAERCVNVHLIRHPARVISSYAAKRENPTLDDIGFEAQTRIFDLFPGPVMDSADIRRDPKAMLVQLCAEIGLPFDPAMLHWVSGPRPYDGAWAPHWYGAVHKSEGFAGPEGPLPSVPAELQGLLDAALPHYRAMEVKKITL